MKIKVKKLHPDAKIPEQKTKGAAGCDISTIEEVLIKPGECKLIKTGLAFEFSKDVVLIMAPRSSLCLKNHLDMPNSITVGDSDYRGEYLMPLRNLGTEDVVIEKGERIGQILFLNVLKAEFEEVEELEDTERGAGGFGSTGKF